MLVIKILFFPSRWKIDYLSVVFLDLVLYIFSRIFDLQQETIPSLWSKHSPWHQALSFLFLAWEDTSPAWYSGFTAQSWYFKDPVMLGNGPSRILACRGCAPALWIIFHTTLPILILSLQLFYLCLILLASSWHWNKKNLRKSIFLYKNQVLRLLSHCGHRKLHFFKTQHWATIFMF